MNDSSETNTGQPVGKRVHKHIMLAAVPHRANDYQPHLIRRYGLLAILLLVVVSQLLYNLTQTGSVLGEGANVSVEALLGKTNEEREKSGLVELKLNDKLSYAAELKAEDMYKNQYWGHVSPEGTEPWYWLIQADYGYSKAGENLARNFYSAEAVNMAWMESTDHRRNILEPDFTEVGFAIANGTLEGEPTTLVVALYGRPVSTGAVTAGELVAGAQLGSLDTLTRIGVGMQSITPALLGSIMILTLLMMIAFVAHLYRDYIPEAMHQPRHRRHHGAIKMSLMFALIIGMLLLYGGGQI